MKNTHSTKRMVEGLKQLLTQRKNIIKKGIYKISFE